MIFSDFIESMTSSSTKTKIINDLTAARDEFNAHVEPCYKSFQSQFGGYTFKADELRAINELFLEDFNVKSRDNFIVNSYDKALAFTVDKIEMVMRMLEDNLAADIMRDAMTLKQVNLIQLSEVISFVVRFSRRLLNYVITVETKYAGTDTGSSSTGMKPAEVNWIQQNIPYYIQALNIISGDTGKVKESMDKIPDVLLQRGKVDATVRLVGAEGDPLKLKFIPVVLNPFYHVGMRIAEYQAARYHEAKHEQQVISAKILYLRAKLDGREDAKRESIIERYEDLLSRMTYKLHKLEEDAS